MATALRRLMVLLLSLVLATGCVDWVDRKIHGVRQGVVLENYDLSGLYPHEVEKVVRQLALERSRPAQNASIDRQTGKVVPEKPGITVLVPETVQAVLMAPRQGKIELVVRKDQPRWTAKDLQDLTPLAEFHTPITGKWQRAVNIRIAAKEIHNFLLYPGEEFSFNRVVGPRTAARGYIGAPEISGDMHIMGIGGGVCQVSTTLFNAVQKLGLEVTERHKHSTPVEYIQWGRDAAVYWGALDFRFKNSSGHPIVIQTDIVKHRFYIKILGRKGNG